MKGLVIKSPHIEKILSGDKIWEIRGKPIKIKGKIALIRSGSGFVVGTAEIIDCIGPLTKEDFLNNMSKHRVDKEVLRTLKYETPYAWVLRNAKEFSKPIPYKHPHGAIGWVDLDKLGIKIE